ncbi:Alpha/Beta hydrolase protein [Rhypophila decipiens]|uniref:Kynurenine formamidase n=1 Tax=Rhypophila decipiens TaxID=261697 RepID=A0AAN6YDW9_9PEZI|nr:Alpha/Beta hydrolase protein [Rhypophila decipiens]
MTDQDWSTWASVPWAPVTDSSTATSSGNIIGWHKQRVPYVPGDHCLSLQTLDVWIPASGSETDSQIPPQTSDLPKLPGRWLVFIHGGAWRDPKVDSSSFSAAALKILSIVTTRIPKSGWTVPLAGMASLNYRLSPYPTHPEDPSPPSDPGATPDPARQAKHPDHIQDVLTGIAFLQRLGGALGSYLLAGHSCGATLAFQAVMNPTRWGLENPPVIAKPSILLGVNGLYDLAGFIAHPPRGYEHLRMAYDEFTRAAFGDDVRVWKAACPATAEAWPKDWIEGKRLYLVDSEEDTLVPNDQIEALRKFLWANSSLPIELRGAPGGHDEIWIKGDRLAELCLEAVGRLDLRQGIRVELLPEDDPYYAIGMSMLTLTPM